MYRLATVQAPILSSLLTLTEFTVLTLELAPQDPPIPMPNWYPLKGQGRAVFLASRSPKKKKSGAYCTDTGPHLTPTSLIEILVRKTSIFNLPTFHRVGLHMYPENSGKRKGG